MKFIWTLLFLAVGGATFGITWLLVPEAARTTQKFWLSMGGIGLGFLLLYVAFAFAPGPRGEQGGELMRTQMAVGSFLYLLATFGLAGVAITGISFTFLLVLHILALLAWVVIVLIGALGAKAMSGADSRK